MNKVFVILFASILGLTQAGLTGDKDCVLYLGFDRYNGALLYDNSVEGNKALLANGASVTKVPGSCGVCAQLLGGNVNFFGKRFRGIPQQQITIAFMIQLLDTKGILRFFETVGDHSANTLPQYRLESQDGRLIWFHRNQLGDTVFGVRTDQPVLFVGKWTHVLVTYAAVSGKAQIYIDGQLVKEETSDPGVPLSPDWGKYAGVGREDGEKNIQAYLDEFYIFNKTLTEMEIKNLISKCSGEKSSVILHLAFAKDNGNVTLDTSGLKNDASVLGLSPIMTSLAVNGTCGMGLKVPSGTGEIKLDGKTMRNKPTDGVTVALWVNVTTTEGTHTLFQTVGGHSMHTKNQFELSITDGAILWMHRNEYEQIVFTVTTEPLILPGSWVHVVGTYTSSPGKARVYINGDLVREAVGAGSLSEDWDGQASFAKHQGKTANDVVYVDEIMIYNRALSPFEVKHLFGKCNFGSSAGGSKGAQLVYYGFDRQSGNHVFDDSGNSIDGTISSLSKVARSTGHCGNALRLSGGDISINGAAMKRRPLMAITVMVWVKLDSIQGDQEVFMTTNPENPGNRHGQYHFQINDGAVRWFHRNSMSQTIFSADTKEPVVPAGTWTHVSATYDITKRQAEIYVNGILKKVEKNAGGILSQDWGGKVVIGKFYDMAENGEWVESQPLLGMIDELYILDKALSKSEIMVISKACNYHRVVLHLGFEKTLGLETFDQSGLGNNGRLVNVTTMPGICGQGMNMSQGEIDLDGKRFREKPMAAITIATWVRLNTNRGYHQLFNTIGSRSEHKHDQYDFAIDNGKVIWAHNDERDKVIFRLETLPVIPARNWSHVAVTYDSTEMLAKVYINGELRKTKSGSGFLSQDWGHFAGIGRHFYEREYLIGATDEFLMYNYALSDQEIQYLAKTDCG